MIAAIVASMIVCMSIPHVSEARAACDALALSIAFTHGAEGFRLFETIKRATMRVARDFVKNALAMIPQKSF